MSDYALGDIQGCLDPLLALLEKVKFDAARDRLFFTGDLVNRGPESLATLRFVAGLGASALTTLGNHDLHLLAMSAGVEKEKHNPTLQPIIEAPDRDELLGWLRRQPLLIEHRGFTITHAGIYPYWTREQASRLAAEVERELASTRFHRLMQHMYGNHPASWSDDLTGYERLRFIINAFTRMRYLNASGELDFAAKGPPGSQPPGLRPWYEAPGRIGRDWRIAFGHWAAHGPCDQPDIFALDTGCVWGGRLTALRFDCDPPRRIQVACGCRP